MLRRATASGFGGCSGGHGYEKRLAKPRCRMPLGAALPEAWPGSVATSLRNAGLHSLTGAGLRAQRGKPRAWECGSGGGGSCLGSIPAAAVERRERTAARRRRGTAIGQRAAPMCRCRSWRRQGASGTPVKWLVLSPFLASSGARLGQSERQQCVPGEFLESPSELCGATPRRLVCRAWCFPMPPKLFFPQLTQAGLRYS